jgi:Ca2+-transporting ATPase
MTVKEIYANGKTIDVSGVGYIGEGDFTHKGKKINPQRDENLKLLLKTAVVCNDARIKRTGEDMVFQVMGSPTEAALLVMASKAEVFQEDFNPRIDEIPFSSETKMMSVMVEEGKQTMVYSKGALEILLDKCAYLQKGNKVSELTKKEKNKILKQKAEMASNSLRTLGLAYRKAKSSKIEEMEKDLIFLGLVGIEDPPREGIRGAISSCKKAGIKIKMITGDDKKTALSIAKQIDLEYGKVLEGTEIDELTDNELSKIVNQVTIFARVRPEHKLRIVRALKERGEIVTMTGDGVNDAPALKEAHIGVAMGKNGTDVSRSVADLTLKDDNFVTMVDAIKEGRTIFNNIRKFVSYQLSCNTSELMILFIGVLLVPFFGWPIPLLLALQILFMNIVTDNLPAITLGLNHSSEDIMREKPRRKAPILNKHLFMLLIASGAIMALFVLVTFYFAFNVLGQAADNARTTALLTLICLEIAGAFNFRSFRKPALTRSPLVNPFLAIASALSIIATILIIYTPLNQVFQTVPLTLVDWVIGAGFGLLLMLIFDIFKRINNNTKRFDFYH